MSILVGIDIGGTKCAVSIGKASNQSVEIIGKDKFLTPDSPEQAIEMLMETTTNLLEKLEITVIDAIGISCGSPLDSNRGLILSPPNLPNWDQVDVITPFQKRFSVPVSLQNDANACALAEWKWGAGQGCRNMVFLTFGTGMGAGLILDGKLYAGTNDNAGEVGHVRLEDEGPVGYGKAGSFEGFCSGGGIAKLAQEKAEKHLKDGKTTLFCRTPEEISEITTKKVGEAAQSGDPLAIEVFEIVAKKLGKGLAFIVDILNPERIVIGSIYGRQQSLLEAITLEVLSKEALPQSLAVCEIVPAGLGEQVGDYASLSVALNTLEVGG
ncbi:ROK family protein [Lederbergia citrea]|uniref:ROK family protein n=1 Tax=Lederbergia citrea TaxID=2833581 RepID=A0A942US02_9BACI|nr:ROK family protein [Lederbergia citrea]MBS4222934.1 ROK family protein [Lederbergia citrea]